MKNVLAAAALLIAVNVFAAPPTDPSLDEMLQLIGADLRAHGETHSVEELERRLRALPSEMHLNARQTSIYDEGLERLMPKIRQDQAAYERERRNRYKEALTQEDVEAITYSLQHPDASDRPYKLPASIAPKLKALMSWEHAAIAAQMRDLKAAVGAIMQPVDDAADAPAAPAPTK